MEQAGGASGVRSVKGRRQGSERELEAVGRKNNATVSALALTVPIQSSPALPNSLAGGRCRSLPTVMVPHDGKVSAFSYGFSGRGRQSTRMANSEVIGSVESGDHAPPQRRSLLVRLYAWPV